MLGCFCLSEGMRGYPFCVGLRVGWDLRVSGGEFLGIGYGTWHGFSTGQGGSRSSFFPLGVDLGIFKISFLFVCAKGGAAFVSCAVSFRGAVSAFP